MIEDNDPIKDGFYNEIDEDAFMKFVDPDGPVTEHFVIVKTKTCHKCKNFLKDYNTICHPGTSIFTFDGQEKAGAWLQEKGFLSVPLFLMIQIKDKTKFIANLNVLDFDIKHLESFLIKSLNNDEKYIEQIKDESLKEIYLNYSNWFDYNHIIKSEQLIKNIGLNKIKKGDPNEEIA